MGVLKTAGAAILTSLESQVCITGRNQKDKTDHGSSEDCGSCCPNKFVVESVWVDRRNWQHILRWSTMGQYIYFRPHRWYTLAHIRFESQHTTATDGTCGRRSCLRPNTQQQQMSTQHNGRQISDYLIWKPPRICTHQHGLRLHYHTPGTSWQVLDLMPAHLSDWEEQESVNSWQSIDLYAFICQHRPCWQDIRNNVTDHWSECYRILECCFHIDHQTVDRRCSEWQAEHRSQWWHKSERARLKEGDTRWQTRDLKAYALRHSVTRHKHQAAGVWSETLHTHIIFWTDHDIWMSSTDWIKHKHHTAAHISKRRQVCRLKASRKAI